MEESEGSSQVEQRKVFPLYNDALQGILKYLNLIGLHVASQVSKQWYQVICTMKSLARSSHARLESIPAHSAVGLHVGYVSGLHAAFRRNPDSLCSLSSVLPNLRVLLLLHRSPQQPDPIISASKCMSENSSLRLPQSLEVFTAAVDIDFHPILLHAIAPLSRLAVLELNFVSENLLLDSQCFLAKMDFSTLPPNSLPDLEKLSLCLTFQNIDPSASISKQDGVCIALDSLPMSLIDFLRARTQLKHLDIRAPTFFPPTILDRLTHYSSDCPLIQSGKLTHVGTDSLILSDESLRSLILMPSITALAPAFVVTNDLHPLSQLPHLISLKLNGHPLSGFSQQLTSAGMLAAVSNCAQLTQLELIRIELGNEDLEKAVASLPHLTDLQIYNTKSLTSLLPLISHDLPSRLTRLTLCGCGPFPVNDIEKYIFPLQQLQHLMMLNCFQENLPREIEQALNNYSTKCRLPKLQTVAI